PETMWSDETGLPVSIETRSACAARMCFRASSIVVGSPGYTQRAFTNLAVLARPSDFFLSSDPPFGTKREDGTRAPYTAARQATIGRLALHMWSVEMCPLVRGSPDASAEMASIGR